VEDVGAGVILQDENENSTKNGEPSDGEGREKPGASGGKGKSGKKEDHPMKGKIRETSTRR